MMNPESKQLVHALRSRATISDEDREQGCPHFRVLVTSVEEALFQARGLGPVPSIVERAVLAMGGDSDWTNLPDQEVHGQWLGTLEKVMLDYSSAPKSWEDPDSSEFLTRAAIVFGVDIKVVPTLLREFHELTREQRTSIFDAIRFSSYFPHIQRELDRHPKEESDLEPRKVLRTLMQAVINAS